MTFSIVARDSANDAVGVAVHSKFVSVGSVVPFAAADAGAIATQSYANVAYGPDGLDLLRDGHDAETVVERLTENDDGAPERQVGVVGQDGSVAAFTGEECLDYAGDRRGTQYAVQGNILENAETLDAMAEAFEDHEGGLPEALIAALHAGNEAGGTRVANRAPPSTWSNRREGTTAATTAGSTSASTTTRIQSANWSGCSACTT